MKLSFFGWFRPRPRKVTLNDLKETELRIMSKISESAAKQTASLARIDAAITGLSGDIDGLKAKIQELQTSPGAITPEDQALLDGLEISVDVIATKLQALDDTTSTVVEPAP